MPVTGQHRRQAERDAEVLLEYHEILTDNPRHNRALDIVTEIEEKAKKAKKDKKP